jgi:DNA-binding winged helix-turn-helix (wHTH) protein/TolB-like protein
MTDDPQKKYKLGPFVLDPQQKILTRDGEIVRLVPKAFEILVCLVRNANRVVRKEDLIRDVWPDSFVEDANLTVHISTLRKVLNGESPQLTTIETLPKVGYRLVIVDGHPGAEQPGSPKPTFISRMIGRTYLRWAIAAVGGTLLLALVFVLSSKSIVHNKAGSQPVTSVAVLPIANISSDPALDYLSDGITEDVIRTLSGRPDLSVKARSTVFQYKGKDLEPRTIGKELSVDAILVGQFTRTGDRIEITYELVETASGNIIVSDKVSRPESEIYLIQDDIVRVMSIKLNLSAKSETVRTKDRDAYELYLRGRYSLNRRTVPDIKLGLGLFQRSIERDPTFALPYSGLADSYELLADYGGAERADAVPKAKAAVLEALKIQPDLAEAHASLGQIIADNENDWRTAESEFNKAIALDPNYSSAFQWYAEMLMSIGRFEEAHTAIHRAIELDPMSRMMRNIEARILVYEHRFDEAIDLLKKNIDLDPRWGGDHDLLFHAYEGKHMYPEAVDAYLTALELLEGWKRSEIESAHFAFNKLGWNGFVKRILNLYVERADREFIRPLVLAEWYARNGQINEAFSNLNKGLKTKSINTAGWVKFLPCYETIRENPDYTSLMRKIASPG